MWTTVLTLSLLGRYPEEKWLSQMEFLLSVFWGTSVLIYVAVALVSMHANSQRGSFSHRLTSSYLVSWGQAFLGWVGISVLMCISLMASDVGHFFIYGPPMLLKCQRLVVQLLIGSFYFPAGPCPKNKGQEHGKIETQMTWGGGESGALPLGFTPSTEGVFRSANMDGWSWSRRSGCEVTKEGQCLRAASLGAGGYRILCMYTCLCVCTQNSTSEEFLSFLFAVHLGWFRT